MFPLIDTLYIRNSPRNSLEITIASPDSDLLIEINFGEIDILLIFAFCKTLELFISPKFLSIKRSESGTAKVISKEFLGEYLIYKVTINGNMLRVRTDINNLLNNGDKCTLSIIKNSYCYLYPGAHKVYL